LASVEGVQKPQAGTAAAGYFGGRTDAARAIGEAYVRQLGLDTSAESIRKASLGALEVIERASSQQNAIRALGLAVRRDFQQGRSVQLEGWIVSRTEAELCASPSFRRRTDPRHSKTTAHGAGASIINGCLARAAVRNDRGGSNAFGFEL
jgi:hypothetical protein